MSASSPPGSPIVVRSPYREGVDRIPRAPRKPTEMARELIFAYQGKRKTQRLLGLSATALGLVSVAFMGWLCFGGGGIDPNYVQLMIYAVSLLGSGFALLLLASYGNRREEKAFREGLPAKGRVLMRGLNDGSSFHGVPPFEVVWEFEAHGVTHQGRLSHVDRALVERALPGEVVTVLYDPADPSANTVWVE
ncbi:DUF3592 domain-containing protein [Chondromyces apiculatus]|nr:DUF3592 domain-containing protein [Chondromyces apiculatus]